MKAIVLSLFFAQFILTSCVSSSCTKTNNAQIIDTPSVIELAKEKYGDIFTLQENETKEFYLVTSRRKSSLETVIKFFVYENEKHEVILEDFINLGSVQWDGRYKINVQKFPGTIKLNDQNDGKNGYFFDVKTGQKSKE